MKFTIDRSKWRCGRDGKHKRGDGPVRLLNTKGFMCCLGQCSKQLGAREEDILDLAIPSEVGIDLTPLTEMWDGVCISSRLGQEAVAINDSGILTDAEREAKLTALFAEHGHEIEFIGEFTT